MTWVIIIAILLGVGAIYAYAKNKGERKKAKEVIDKERELDREEADNDLEDKRDSNAWDELDKRT